MENNEQWGVGKERNSKAFDKIFLYNQEYDLIFGEFSHSTSDNTTYARNKEGIIHNFSGHRRPFKIEIEEYNYLKESELSGDEIRKGCTGKLFINNIQCYECGGRTYDRAYKNIEKFIEDMESEWHWYPNDINYMLNNIVAYEGLPFYVERVIIDQAALILRTLDNQNRTEPLFYERYDEDRDTDWKYENYIKVSITEDKLRLSVPQMFIKEAVKKYKDYGHLEGYNKWIVNTNQELKTEEKRQLIIKCYIDYPDEVFKDILNNILDDEQLDLVLKNMGYEGTGNL